MHFIPKKYLDHPSVAKLSRRRKKRSDRILMDVGSLASLGFRGEVMPKEGRPDIVHRTLLSVTDSPLFLMGKVKLYLHTLEGRIFVVSEGIRPPRSYNRFVGLMEKLLLEGSVGPPDGPLIKEVKVKLEDVVNGRVLILHEKGELVDPIELITSTGEDFTIIVGAFPHGDFREEVLSLGERISLFRGTLSSSAAISMMLAYAYYVEMWYDRKEKG